MKILDLKFNHSTQSFSDISGKSVLISKSGTFRKTIPLCAYSSSAILIDPSNSVIANDIPIAQKSHEAESFSIGMYFKPGAHFDVAEENIFYSPTGGVGLVFINGKIIFRVTDSNNLIYNVIYKLQKVDTSYYVTARYSPGLISLMLNGSVVSSIQVPYNFKFKATSPLDFNSSVATDYIIIDKVQIFNYDLQTKEIMKSLVDDSIVQNPGQIISSDDGIYFDPDYRIKPIQAGFSYNTNKDFTTGTMNGVEVSSSGTLVLSDSSGASSGYLLDSFFFPPLTEQNHNIVSWVSDSKDIQFGYNTDGGSTYTNVENGYNIPGFSGGMLYYKISMSTDNYETNKPVLSNLSFLIYDNKSLDSKNSLYQITTDYNYVVGQTLSPISHDGYQGLKTIGGGFRVNGLDVRTVEFFYRPGDISQTCLIDCGDARYSWSAAGNVTKSNISSIYVNGLDLTSQTSASSIFSINKWHHVVITFTANKQSNLFFNQSSTGTLLGPDSRFTHIGIYSTDKSSKALSHYQYITSRVSQIAFSESIDIGSDNFSGFNIDKIVISTQ